MCWLIDKLFDLLLYTGSRLYRWVVSPFLHTLAGAGYGCRFEPTCGDYAHEAFRSHGLFKGAGLALLRVSRCHPFSGRSGFDPVPPPLKSSRSSCCACSPRQAVLSPNTERNPPL